MSLTQEIQRYILKGEGDFNSLSLAVFAYQYQYCQPYQHYCRQLNKSPEQVQNWRQVPAVSTEVFREFDLCTFAAADAQYVFQTSGTSQDRKGKHYYHDLSLYEAAIQASFMAGLGLSAEDKAIFRVLTPSFSEHPTSSLYYMFQKILAWYGEEGSRFYFKQGELACTELAADLAEDSSEMRPVILLGTAFSFVHFCDYLSHHSLSLKLPKQSRLVETGGLKGRSRSLSRDELYQLFTTKFGLEPSHCFSEYGMTELSSQCYSGAGSPIFKAPPWMPVSIIDPESGAEVAEGETGLIQFFDLANHTAVSAILTSDLARKHAEGFELLGRAPKATLRGCSLTFER